MLAAGLVCKTNSTWVQFPSCSLWKVSIIGNAAVLKTAVRVTAFAGSSPAPSALIVFGEQADIGLLRHPAKMFHAVRCGEGSIPLFSAFNRQGI